MLGNTAKTFSAAAVVIFLMAVSTTAASTEESLKIKFGIHFASTSGRSSSQFFDMIKGPVAVFKEKYGCEFVMKTYPSYAAVAEAFLKNEIGMAVLPSGGWAVESIRKGAAVHPWATYTMKKRRKSVQCIWHRKSEKIQKVSEVTGKRLIASGFNTDWLLFLRDYLFRNGVDKPLWHAFRSFTSISGTNSTFMALAAGEGDFIWGEQDFDVTLKLMAPNVANQVAYSLCGDAVHARGTIVLNKKTLSKADLNKLDEALVGFLEEFNDLAKTDIGIRTLKQYMNLVQARIVPAQPDEYDYDIKLYEDARKRGWITEAEFIIAQMEKAPKGKAVEIKPNFDYCQKVCPAGKGQMPCIDKCME